MNNQPATIQLNRIHALNWYGFADSFDLAGQTLVTGILGCGKTALVDLVQTVLLAKYDNYNLSVGEIGSYYRHINLVLIGYVLQDLNTGDGLSRNFARQSTRAYIALGWIWPQSGEAKNDANNPPRHETWGVRIEYTSVGADPEYLYWNVPTALEFDDFLGEDDVPLAADAWKRKLDEHGGTHFASKEQYLETLSAPRHLNFDHAVFKQLLTQTLRFSFGSTFDEFCRNHILPEARINIEETRRNYDTYRNIVKKLKNLQYQESELKKVVAAFRNYREHDERVLALGWFEHDLRKEERSLAIENAEQELAETRRKTEEWNKESDALCKQHKEAERLLDQRNEALAQTPNAQEFEHFTRRQEKLPGEIRALAAAIGDPAEALHSQFDRFVNHAAAADQCARVNKWETPSAGDTPEKLPAEIDAGAISETARKFEDASSSLARQWREIFNKADSTASSLKSRQSALRGDIERLRKHGTTERLPLHEALVARFGKNDRNPIPLLGELCEITDPNWADAIEIAFEHKLASLVPDASAAGAFAILNALSEVNPRERVVSRAESLALPKIPALSNSLANKIKTDEPAVARLVAHLFGQMVCADNLADAERFPCAILRDGTVKTREGSYRRATKPIERCIGPKAREAAIRAREQELAELETLCENARLAANAADRCAGGFDELREQFRQLCGESVEQLRQLEELRDEQEQVTRRLAQFDNRELLEEMRKQANTARKQVEKLSAQIRDLNMREPVPDAQKVMALNTAKGAFSDAENTALAWNANNPTAGAIAKKHEMLRDDAVRRQTASRPPSETAAYLAKDYERQQAEEKGICVQSRERLRADPRFTDYRDADTGDVSNNTLWDKKLEYITETGIAEFTEKMRGSEREWEESFQKNVLGQLSLALGDINETFRGLQRLLTGRSIGGTRYTFVHRQNTDGDFSRLRDLAQNLDLHNSFFGDATTKAQSDDIRNQRREAMKLFEEPAAGDIRAKQRQQALLDPRFYFTYDMEITEPGRSAPVSLNRRGRKGSGGETYNPYLIALLTAYMRAFRRHEKSRRASISLLLMDEAFKVNDSAAVRDCVRIIAELGFQGVISCTNTVGSQVIESFDWAMIVQKQVAHSADTIGDIITNTVFAAPKNDPKIWKLAGQ